MVEQAAVNGRRFADVQRSFAAHIRDPQGQPRPAGVDERRMAVYRELVFNNIASLLAANFPVIRQILDDEHWEQLVRGFFIHHRCTTPLFHELGQEFLSYLQEVRAGDPQDPPFLLELAHYEWVELALDISEEEPDPALANPNGDLLAETPVVSPLAWNLSYRFPVHRIGPGHQPEAPPPEPTHLVVYRTRDGRVDFLEINAVTQRLLQLLNDDPAPTGLEAVTRIAHELRHPRPEQVIEAGRELLGDLRRRSVVLGTRR
jgi:uncharacterized protein